MGRLLVLAVLAAVIGLAGCREERRILKIWSATDAVAMQDLLDDFGRRNPDITIQYTEFNTSELHAAVLAAEARSDVPRPDVVISSAMDLQVDLVNHGLAEPIDVSTKGPDWANWRGELFGFTAEPVAVVYNVAAFEGRALPQSRSELASMIRDDPAFFDGRVATYDITRSGVGYMFATQDAVRGYQSTRLVETLGRARSQTFCCTGEMIAAVASGQARLAYNVIGSYAQALVQDDPRLALHFLSDYTLVFARSAFVPHWTGAPQAATRFVDYLISPAGQGKIAEGSQLLPLSAVSGGGAAGEPNTSLSPIRMSPGLLTFLDKLKKERFLRDWRRSLFREVP
ncbi:iron ABC transporter substrate-binding protein [Acuticoccus sediminis]|uniref:Iron ABC transporter substrate-binding protein n=1 Tax=Acuticoccus sediminis TaxID=2184697 RepID=A0A8B2NZB5_9HYPH|nr:ABC transporter substrate-binding protein [Acuticoccus sediminis]RAI03226.1 iron ABC transporter substrate-binding protein [Acuticoccus sediminis]